MFYPPLFKIIIKMNLSLAITTYNRFELTIESCAQVIGDPRIDDIVILDDASTDGSFEKLAEYYNGRQKVRVIRQAQNRGMSINKRDAIGYAKNDYAIILDSDNIIGVDYLNAFYEQIQRDRHPNEWCIYLPDFAKPNFNFRKYSGRTYTKIHKPRMADPMGNCMMNCCNYIVNKSKYLEVYQHNPDHICSDTVWFNYLWLKAGYGFYVVPGMEYYHRVHNGSGFMQDINYNMAQSEKVRKMIMAL